MQTRENKSTHTHTHTHTHICHPYHPALMAHTTAHAKDVLQ